VSNSDTVRVVNDRLGFIYFLSLLFLFSIFLFFLVLIYFTLLLDLDKGYNVTSHIIVTYVIVTSHMNMSHKRKI